MHCANGSSCHTKNYLYNLFKIDYICPWTSTESLCNFYLNHNCRYSSMMDIVNSSGGQVVIFSRMHVSGEELEKVTGVAALLRYPCPELQDL